MREIRASVTLTIYHDGQFWIGMFESIRDGLLSACRVVFGAEPSTEEVARLVCEWWGELRFTEPVEGATAPRPASNPKRRQREASRELRQRGASTKAQQAISEAREADAERRSAVARERREGARKAKFEQRQEKRRQKHRGR